MTAAGSPGEIERFMTYEHVRLARLLATVEKGNVIDEEAYARFRDDLFQLMAMEEIVLLPYARRKRGGVPLAITAAVRTDHMQIARLLQRPPSVEIVAALRDLLVRHDPLEEGPDGLYAQCDALAGREAAHVVRRLRAQPRTCFTSYRSAFRPGARNGM